MRPLSLFLLLLLALPTIAQPPKATPGNRLAYLDELDPYYPHTRFPKLITPQWVGDPDVEAVVILAIDDMKDPKKYETFLRPILNRLKKIDGRAPVSIMTCSIDPQDPQLQAWLKEGLSLEVHTVDHPCPYFRPGFDKAKDTYDRCVDLMHMIPNNKPVCFRMPCCDSMNTPSPRHWAEIFNQKTAKGNYLSLDSSVFQVFTSDDPELPKELVLEDGKERFKKYLPMDRDFVNWIENYPYPYVIGKYCWQFPCMTPSDWQAQHLHKPNNPITLRDWKAALDCTVIKQGVFNMVFHPHGWTKAEQIIELIDHAVAKHGKKVKFLTFKEASDRLQEAVYGGPFMRTAGRAPSVVDVNNDGYMDFIDLRALPGRCHIWKPETRTWASKVFKKDRNPESEHVTSLQWGIVQKTGQASLTETVFRVRNKNIPEGHFTTLGHFDKEAWHSTALSFKDPPGEREYRFVDIDGDGVCEMIQNSRVSVFNTEFERWHWLPFVMPTTFHSGLRFLDLNGNGKLDIVFSNEKEWGVYLFIDVKTGWKKLRAGKPGDEGAIPMIAKSGPATRLKGRLATASMNNGCWAHSGHLWWANEDTHLLKNHVDRRSFKSLLEVK